MPSNTAGLGDRIGPYQHRMVGWLLAGWLGRSCIWLMECISELLEAPYIQRLCQVHSLIPLVRGIIPHLQLLSVITVLNKKIR